MTVTTPTEVEPRRIAEILSDAKFLLETDGWTTGEFKCTTGAQCAAGAVYAACGLPYEELRDEDDELCEYGVSASRLDNPEYVASIKALARAMDKKRVENLEEMAAQWGDLFPHNEPSSGAYEETVTTYNDNRVNTNVGRNVILRRFDKAIADVATK